MANRYSRTLDQVAGGSHDHFLREVADLELKILHHQSPNLDDQALHDLRLKSQSLDLYQIDAHRQGRDLIATFAVGFGDPFQARSLMAHGDDSAGNDGSGRVRDVALQGRSRLGVRSDGQGESHTAVNNVR